MATSNLAQTTAKQLEALGVTFKDVLLVAVSGGRDSVTLLSVLHQLQVEGKIGELHIAHVNHELRGEESNADEVFVRQLAEAYNIPIHVLKINTKESIKLERTSIEAQAREERYVFFSSIAKEINCKIILTAHTLNDHIETSLMNFARGSGARGLAGIPQQRALGDAVVLRPWLDISRGEINRYIEQHALSYREDSTNKEKEFLRNRVRHVLLPTIQEVFAPKNALEGIARSIAYQREVADFISGQMLEAYHEMRRAFFSSIVQRSVIALDYLLFKNQESLLQIAIIEHAFSELLGASVYLTAGEQQTLKHFLHELEVGTTGKSASAKTELRSGFVVLKEEDRLLVEVYLHQLVLEALLPIGGEVQTPIGILSASVTRGFTKPLTANEAIFDLATLPSSELMIRPWENGDRMQPFGMAGKSKLVSDLLNEAGIHSERLKRQVPLVVLKDAPSVILWIPGVRASELGRVQDGEGDTFLRLLRTQIG